MRRKSKKTIINETREYYKNNSRAIDTDESGYESCVYLNSEGDSCAVGRCIPLNRLKSLSDSNGKAADDFDDLDSLLRWDYRGHDVDFWCELQEFHDNYDNWEPKVKGPGNKLTNRGRRTLRRLLKEYS
jgi:hypothetical protein